MLDPVAEFNSLDDFEQAVLPILDHGNHNA